ncbi:MAG TPA: nodulation protein NfeD [Candidatus Limnocylindria bacterium]|nr:nodulation protein NfeD [Candidatus Limnocylindria bacterium]
MVRRALAALSVALGIVGLAAPAAADSGQIARIELSGVIDQVNAAYIEEALQVAADDGHAAALVVIDSPGGELTSMDRILKAMLASEVPVITWVAPEGARAGSAATFVTLAGDVAAMAPNTNIGAASVVGGQGEDLPDTLARKVTNDAVARIRTLADAHGRNADWAESAVRQAASISASEAVAMDPPVADLIAGTTDELFAAIDEGTRADGRPYDFNGEPLPKLSGLDIVDLEMNPGQQFLHLLSDPNIAFLLFTIGFYGIIAELFHPNFFSGILGAIAIIVALIGSNALPLNVGGLLLVLGGIGLLALETVVASYGLLTAGGIVAFVLGAFALWTGVRPGDFAFTVGVSPWLIVVVVAVGVVYIWVLIRALLQMRRQGGVANKPVDALVGATATAQTVIAPTGIAYADGESWSARSRDVEIRAGTPLRVIGVDGLQLIVEPARPAGDGGATSEG